MREQLLSQLQTINSRHAMVYIAGLLTFCERVILVTHFVIAECIRE
jgi:hypothetical protein